MGTRYKEHKTTISARPNGGLRVYYWIFNNATQKFLRKSKDFSAKRKNDARKFANDRDAENTLPREISVSIDDRIILSRLKKFGDLNEVLKFLEANYKIAGSSEILKVAFDEFIREKAKTNRRPRTISDYESFRNKLKDFHNMEMKDIGDSVAENMLSLVRSSSRKLKMAACLSALFNWSIRKKYCVHNPFYPYTKSDVIKDKEHVPTLRPNEAKEFLAYLPPTIIAGYAIMLFAGVRPAEVFNDDGKPVLRWEDIDFDKRTILIRADTSKTHAARILQHLPDNLWKWLNVYRRNNGNVIAISAGRVSKNRREACNKANIKFAIDICRHSFGSHGYYYLGAEHTVKLMGHVGGFATFAKHYEGISNPKEAKEYFTITPDNTPSKWIHTIPYPGSKSKGKNK